MTVELLEPQNLGSRVAEIAELVEAATSGFAGKIRCMDLRYDPYHP
jgi:hypothetical protein